MGDSEATRAPAPIALRERIAVLDVLRGIAILGIFFMNIPFMGLPVLAEMRDVRLGGWMPADRWAWGILQVVAEGTQRGVLEFLFGAGMMILTARAMDPDGPVAIADLYLRRTLWLLAFGLADAWLLLWPGDILHVYALAALPLIAFRRLPARALLAIGLAWAAVSAAGNAAQYAERAHLVADVRGADAARAAHRPLTPPQRAAVRSWNEKRDDYRLHDRQRAAMAEEAKARRGGFAGYAAWVHAQWLKYDGAALPFWVIEAFSTMLVGVALYKWGIVQGLRSARFYWTGAAIAYALGMGARAVGVAEAMAFAPMPKTIWITAEPARLAVSFGHVCLVNALLATRGGAALLRPFAAAGRTAFSLYVCETIIGMWLLFPGFGFGLWDRFGWFGLAMVALGCQAGLLLLANLWLRGFVAGPLEWLWRSLAYRRRQPFRRAGAPVPATVTGP